MAKGLQLLLAGVLLGLMGVFAVIGVQSVLKDRAVAPPPQQPELVQQGQQSSTITPQTGTDTSMTMADQAAQKPADTTQLTPSDDHGQQNSQQAGQQTQQQPATNNADITNTAANDANTNNVENAAQQTAETAQQQAAAQPTESTEEESKLDMQLIDEFGGLQLTLSDPATPGQPALGQFTIRDSQDQVVADMKDTDTASFDLSPGIYEVTVIARGKKSARMVNIVTGEFVTEHFELPSQGAQAGQTNQAGQQQGQDNSQQALQQDGQGTVAQEQNQQSQQANQVAATPGLGKLSVRVQAAGTRAPLKSNIYVQLPNGKHITKKNYADFGAFDLRPGTYKVTVKAQGKVDVVRNIGIKENDNIQQVFLMESPSAQAPNKPALPSEGTLSMMLQAPQGQKNQRGRFIIQDAQGKRVTRMRGVSNADIKLKPGRYNVVAVYRGARLTKPVDVFKDKTSRIVFNLNEFPQQAPAQQNQNQQTQQQAQQVQVPAKQGVLQLIAVSGVTKQPLKVNFMVSTLNGQRLKVANNVSVTEVSVPPQDVLVDIAYEEMRGQERIRVKAGEPTVFTFTVTPNNNAAAPIDQMRQQAPKSMEEMLMERLQQEVLQRLTN